MTMTRPKRSVVDCTDEEPMRKKLATSDDSFNNDKPCSSYQLPRISISQQQYPPGLDHDEDDEDDVPESKTLVSLPLLVLDMIVDHLTLQDICNLARVSKYFNNFIKSFYDMKVILQNAPPANSTATTSPEPSSLSTITSTSSETSSNLSVLDLSIMYNLSLLPTGKPE